MPAAVLLTAKHIHFHSFVLSLSKGSELIKEDGIHAQSEIIKDLRDLLLQISELQSPHLFSRNKEKMSQSTLYTASIVFVENNLLLSLVSGSRHLPGGYDE